MNVQQVMLGLWLAAILALGGFLTASHEAPLPQPLPAQGPAGSTWTVLHGLSAKCPCSRRVIDHLLARGADPRMRERVVLVDGSGDAARKLLERGFELDEVSAEVLATRYGLSAAPMLVMRRPDGTVAYWGAYAPRRNVPPQDLELIDRVLTGETPAPFPLFGCALTRELQARVDPLDLKYGAWR